MIFSYSYFDSFSLMIVCQCVARLRVYKFKFGAFVSCIRPKILDDEFGSPESDKNKLTIFCSSREFIHDVNSELIS